MRRHRAADDCAPAGPMPFPPWVPPLSRAIVLAFVLASWWQARADGELDVVKVAAGIGVVALASASATMSDRGPAGAWWAAGLAAAVGPVSAVLAGGRSNSIAWFAVVFVAGQAGVTLPLRNGGVALAVMTAVVLGAAIAQPESSWLNWLSALAFGFGGGALFRVQGVAGENARRAEAAAERQRIAHDLHDVVAHTLAVTVLHLGAARVAIDHEPERAGEALAEAERLARRSMAELRRVVGALGDGAAGAGPAPPEQTAAAVLDLVAEYERAGVPVRAALLGDLEAVDGPRGAVVYRLVQESLANAALHAPGLPVEVSVTALPEGEVRVEVVNPLPAGARVGGGHGPGGGHGIGGMRARVAALAGTVSAGPVGGRWVVKASLP